MKTLTVLTVLLAVAGCRHLGPQSDLQGNPRNFKVGDFSEHSGLADDDEITFEIVKLGIESEGPYTVTFLPRYGGVNADLYRTPNKEYKPIHHLKTSLNVPAIKD